MAPPFRFVVPPYQRGYAWTTKEAGQLLEDIVAASGVDDEDTAEPDYFLGSMLLMNTDDGVAFAQDDQRSRAHEIVDGQQRLVTLCIITSVLRDLEADAASDAARTMQSLIALPDTVGRDRWRLVLRGRPQSFLETFVLAPGGCAIMPDDEALGRVEARILEIREEFLSVLCERTAEQRARLAQYLTQHCHVVVMLTGDIDRAHRMFLVMNGRGRPLSRNDILKAEILSSIAADESDAVLTTWEQAAEGLGPEDFEAFFAHIRSIYGQRRPQIIAGMRSIIATVGGGGAFLDTVFRPLAAAYRAIVTAEHDGSLHSAAIRQSLVYLNRLSGTEWRPAAMQALHKLAGEPAKLAQTLSEIDRFAHLLRVLCLGHGKRLTRFTPVIEALNRGEPISEACRLDREERKMIAYHLRDLHARSSPVCKLILMRLNDKIAGRFHATEPAQWSIEHVLPKRPADASEWRSWYPDHNQREAATESLGNLLLVTQAVNDRARNQSFERKREIYRDGGDDIMAPLRLDVLQSEQWQASDVAQRQARLFAHLDEMWGLGLESLASGETTADIAAGRRRRFG